MLHPYHPKRCKAIPVRTRVRYLRGSQQVTGTIVEPLTDGLYVVRPLHSTREVKLKAACITHFEDLKGAPPPPPPKAPAAFMGHVIAVPPGQPVKQFQPPTGAVRLACFDGLVKEAQVRLRPDGTFPAIVVTAPTYFGEDHVRAFYCVGTVERGAVGCYNECTTFLII